MICITSPRDPSCFTSPTECPPIQFNSETNYLVLTQTSQIRAQFYKTASASDASLGPLALLSSLAENSGVLTMPLSRLITHLNNSQNSEKLYTYNYHFIIKDTIKQLDEEIHRARCGRVQSTGLCVPVGSGYATQLVHQLFAVQDAVV